jgi:RNA polymerase sigma-70 factor (ECF subfamily)
MEIPYESPEQSDLIATVLSLPPDLRQVIYLHFYEDMTVPKIAELLNKNINSVYTMLRRAKNKLKVKLKEEFCDGAI